MRYRSLRWIFSGLALAGALAGNTSAFGEELNFSDYYAGSNSKVVNLPSTVRASHSESVAKLADESAAPAGASSSACGCSTGAESCGCQSNCNIANDCCAPCKSHCGHWIAGAEAVFLSPDYDNAGSVAFIADFTFAGIVNVFDAAGSEVDDLTGAPRVWLGYQGEQNGFQIRYFRLQDSESLGTPFSAVNFVGFEAENDLELQTFDLEFTRLFCHNGNEGQFTFGGRYARLDTLTGITATSAVGTEFMSGSAFTGFQFDGVGLTSSLNGKRQIGCRGLNFFYSGRVSFLWDDEATASVSTQAFQAGAVNTAFRADQGIASSDTDLFIGEIQVGLQYDYALKCVPANAFIRGAFEYQYWDTTGAGSLLTVSRAELVGVESATAIAVSGGDAILDLVGFSIGAGITW